LNEFASAANTGNDSLFKHTLLTSESKAPNTLFLIIFFFLAVDNVDVLLPETSII